MLQPRSELLLRPKLRKK